MRSGSGSVGAPRTHGAFRAGTALAASGALALAAIPASAPVHAQTPLLDRRVPMRDGVGLSTDIWLPEQGGPFPVVLVRTPYLKSIEFERAQIEAFTRAGYALAVQDTRGRGDSDGEFGFFFVDAEDGFDTVEWLARQPWSDGRVGMTGGSYHATAQWLTAREKPPHLACIVPQAPGGRWFDELPYLGGAFRLQWALGWIHAMYGRVLQGRYTEPARRERAWHHRPLLTADSVLGRELGLYRDFLSHPTRDAYWERITFGPEEFRELDLPAYTWTGWFDGDQSGALHFWRGMRRHSPAAGDQYLIIGPWTHDEAIRGMDDLALGDLRFTPEAMVDVDSLHIRFFDWCLKGARDGPGLPRARVYLTGSNRWLEFDDYPPRQVEERFLYLDGGGHANTLAGDGRLVWEAPSGQSLPDRYAYDPDRPVPSDIGGESHGIDQRAIERRDDVLVYTGEPLARPLDIVGHVEVVLHAATDARDTDWVVKLVDVHPDGRAIRLGPYIGVRRARYRDGYESDVPVVPGEVTEYRIELFDIGHTFLPGHRVRLEVTSSAFPAIDSNLNTGNPVATDTAEAVVANQSVFHDEARPSRIVLPVLGRSDSPRPTAEPAP